jgi:hypothetical protein
VALYKRNSDPATAIIQAFQYHEAKRAPTSLGYLTFDRCAAFVLTTVPVRHVEGIAELLMISFVSIESGFCYGLRATQHRLFLR